MKLSYIKCTVALVLYLSFLLWVGSWWGLLVVPFIIDAYITKKIPWSWWRKSKNPAVRTVMSWVDAIVFALVAIYFVNLYFFQNFVIPSSSLEKSLLVGDYLFVSKMSYGPRVPQTPLTMPLTSHTLPVFNCKSYLEWPQWEYRRVKGFGDVKLNDIVVFNYPAGDTVALNMQNSDFYTLCYQKGAELLPFSGLDSLSAAAQRPFFEQQYAAGRYFMEQNPQLYGGITSRPVDRRENYVKRCVGMPGQTLQIKNRIVYLDGKPNKEPDNVQYNYLVRFRSNPPEEMLRDLSISMEDLSMAAPDDYALRWMPLTQRAYQALKARPDIVESIEATPGNNIGLYPHNLVTGWTTYDYGPIWIPKKGETLELTLENLPVYERPIRIYEGNKLEVRDGQILLNGKPASRYTFKMDYYWMMGDNRDNSADSRCWGFVPEDHIVGKPIFVWLSLNPDYGWTDGKIRWDRFFRMVDNIK